MVDRRMLSYETALETLGFDYQNKYVIQKLIIFRRDIIVITSDIF